MTVEQELEALRADYATLLAERDAMQSMATQAQREVERLTRERDGNEAQWNKEAARHERDHRDAAHLIDDLRTENQQLRDRRRKDVDALKQAVELIQKLEIALRMRKP